MVPLLTLVATVFANFGGIVMPEIETKNEWASGLKGVNLFHNSMSNCSQRTRVALEEKEVSWTSHHLDIAKDEHATDAYQSINPNGVVPTLVHDGRTIIESIDIISYVDEIGHGPSLVPDTDDLRAELDAQLTTAGDTQGAIKVLSHEFLFKPVRKMNDKQLAALRATHGNRDLIAFHEEFSKGFSDERLASVVKEFADAFDRLEGLLQSHGGPWLLGTQFTLVDIAWIVNVHRLDLMRFDFRHWPALKAWLGRMQQRPSYKNGLEKWEPKGILRFYGLYSRLRSLFGGGVNAYIRK